MSQFYVTQRIRVVREKSGKYPYIIGAEGFIAHIHTCEVHGTIYALNLPGVRDPFPVPPGGSWTWWAESDEIEPILFPPEVVEEEEVCV